jgi:hypothetical protein
MSSCLNTSEIVGWRDSCRTRDIEHVRVFGTIYMKIGCFTEMDINNCLKTISV